LPLIPNSMVKRRPNSSATNPRPPPNITLVITLKSLLYSLLYLIKANQLERIKKGLSPFHVQNYQPGKDNGESKGEKCPEETFLFPLKHILIVKPYQSHRNFLSHEDVTSTRLENSSDPLPHTKPSPELSFVSLPGPSMPDPVSASRTELLSP